MIFPYDLLFPSPISIPYPLRSSLDPPRRSSTHVWRRDLLRRMRRKKRCSEPEPWRTMTYETHGDDWGSLSETPIFIHDRYIYIYDIWWSFMILVKMMIWYEFYPLHYQLTWFSNPPLLDHLGPFSGQGWLDLGFPGGEKPIAITVAINSYSYSHENSFNTYHWLWKL